jgi:hypothetical protein
VKRTPAALGFAAHTGWASMLAAAGPPTAPEVLLRARIEMIADGSRFAYHIARELPLDAAARTVAAAAERARTQARAALRAALEDLRARGYDVVASGLIVAKRPVSGELAAVLASHSAVHSAEGELYRAALREASAALKVAVVEVRAADLLARGAALLGVGEADLAERLAAIGKVVGQPWSKDFKDALLVAGLALSSRRRSNVS